MAKKKSPDPIIPGFMTTAEVADHLALSPQRVRQLQITLQARDVAGVLLYPEEVVKEYGSKPRPKPGWKKGRPRGKVKR